MQLSALSERLGEDDAGASDAGAPEANRDAGPPPVPDTTAPTVTLSAPTADCLDGPVSFVVIVEDEESSVGLVSARFAGTDLQLTNSPDDTWTAPFDASPLFTGAHVLEVTAIDTANNLAELRRTFGHAGQGEYYAGAGFSCGDPPDGGAPDSEDPAIEILTPPATIDAYAVETLAIGVRATDDVGPLTVVATLGAASTELAGVIDLYNGTLDVSAVSEGQYTLEVTATDAVARSAVATRQVTVDRTAPTISIVEPTSGQTRAAFTDVVAQASDDRALERVTLYEQGEADSLGVATSPTVDGRWGVIYQLPCAGLPRQVTFEMVARDRAGNEASDTVTVTVDTTGCGS